MYIFFRLYARNEWLSAMLCFGHFFGFVVIIFQTLAPAPEFSNYWLWLQTFKILASAPDAFRSHSMLLRAPNRE